MRPIIFERPWVVVGASGDDNHLQSFTRALSGTDLPRQFAMLAGERSLLQSTLELAAAITDLDRILVVVSARHADLAREQIGPIPGVEIVVQPRDLDSAPATLLPLARVLERDPLGRVVFLPAHHYIADGMPLLEALGTASLPPVRDHVTLIGATPTGTDVEDGWIVRGQAFEGTDAYQVRRLCDVPAGPCAERIRQLGGLWNTLIAAGPITAFWDLVRAHLPEHAARFERYIDAIGTGDERRTLIEAYAAMAPADFNRDLLAKARDLAVIPTADTGWSDWDSPRQVIQSLQGTPLFDHLLARIRESVPPPFARAS